MTTQIRLECVEIEGKHQVMFFQCNRLERQTHTLEEQPLHQQAEPS